MIALNNSNTQLRLARSLKTSDARNKRVGLLCRELHQKQKDEAGRNTVFKNQTNMVRNIGSFVNSARLGLTKLFTLKSLRQSTTNKFEIKTRENAQKNQL